MDLQTFQGWLLLKWKILVFSPWNPIWQLFEQDISSIDMAYKCTQQISQNVINCTVIAIVCESVTDKMRTWQMQLAEMLS